MILVSLGLSACSTNIGEMIPASVGGLPANAPERPAAAPIYPAVHDMPPPRPIPVLDDDTLQKLEKDLVTARKRQEGRKPDAADSQGAGADRNP